jgi:sigma-70-like protein
VAGRGTDGMHSAQLRLFRPLGQHEHCDLGVDVRNHRLPDDDGVWARTGRPVVSASWLPSTTGRCRRCMVICCRVAAAEDRTAETFMAAVGAVERGTAAAPTVAWLIGIARHKLVDHWRRVEREHRNLVLDGGFSGEVDDPWPKVIDGDAVHAVLARLRSELRWCCATSTGCRWPRWPTVWAAACMILRPC